MTQRVTSTPPTSKMLYFSVFLLTFVSTSAMEVDTMADAMIYLKKYYMAENYTNPDFGSMENETEMAAALRSYQRSMALNETGVLDDETKEMMAKPHCGNPTLTSEGDDFKKRRKRASRGRKWDNSSPLSYRFLTDRYSEDLDNTVIASTIARAFQYWSNVTNIDFRFTTSRDADINIRFARGRHPDDTSAFDGPLGVLAHAFFPGPGIGGDAHFDEDESWTINTRRGIDLLQVAVHEFGHSLGLGHSSVRDAVMFASYTGYKQNLVLHENDITRIQALYGVRQTTTSSPGGTGTPTISSTTTTTMPPTDQGLRQRFCQNVTFDAITRFGRRTYAFQDDMYVELDSRGIKDGYPRLIAQDWPGAPNNIDAAVYWTQNRPRGIYIFKGSQFWVYNVRSRDIVLLPGYPQEIGATFPGIPDDIESVFIWRRTGRAYVFKDDSFYRLSSRTVASPRDIRLWGLEKTYGAAFTARNRRTYMFDGDRYVRYNSYRLRIDNANPPYPRSIDEWWTRCDSQNIQQLMEMDSDPDEAFEIIPQENNKDHDTGGGARTLKQTISGLAMVTFLALCLQ